jgi:hypothetical protein
MTEYKTMDERLKRAEAYYQVAGELKVNAERMLETAFMLSEMADRICEANMREKQPSMADCVKLDGDGNPISPPDSAKCVDGEGHGT